MGEKFAFWKSMDGTRKISFVLLVIIMVSFPVFVLALLNPKIPLFSQANTPTTPTTPPTEIDYCNTISGNLIKNYNFEKGKINWKFHQTTNGSFRVVNNKYSCKKAANILIKKNSRTQLYQNGILLEPNTFYELQFDARTSRNQNIEVFIHQHKSPYTNYGLDFNAGLTTDWQTFKTTFTTPTSVYSNARIRFWFNGKKGDEYYLDDVILRKVVEPAVTSTPTPIASKRVFITSKNYDGNLGGLVGGDAKCQERADAAGLGGIWKAWLSSDTVSVLDRLTHSVNPYYLVNGDVIANNWSDLVDGSLNNPININEDGQVYNSSWVWTNSFADGTIRQSSDSSCINWTSNGDGGSTGDSSRSDQGWSNYGASACRYPRPIYCIEQ